jgi:hypothetical protein
MSNNPVQRGRKGRACNRWDCWACWPVGLLLACWACCWLAGLAGLVPCCSFSFFNTSLHLKHNIKFRHYKIKMMHVNKLFLYNVIK